MYWISSYYVSKVMAYVSFRTYEYNDNDVIKTRLCSDPYFYARRDDLRFNHLFHDRYVAISIQYAFNYSTNDPKWKRIYVYEYTYTVCMEKYTLGFRNTVIAFFRCMGLLILIEQFACAFGALVSAVSPGLPVALTIIGPMVALLSMVAGIFANIS